jgi:hypothetical protein
MSRFVVCPDCQRHVRRTEAACPFCASAIPIELRDQDLPAPPAGASRSQAYAFRAAILASTLSAMGCGSTTTTGGGGNGGASGSGGTSSGGTGGIGTGGSGGTNTGGSGGVGTAGNGGASGGGGTSSGGTGGTGGATGGTGGIPLPYGCVWPGNCGPIKT